MIEAHELSWHLDLSGNLTALTIQLLMVTMKCDMSARTFAPQSTPVHESEIDPLDAGWAGLTTTSSQAKFSIVLGEKSLLEGLAICITACSGFESCTNIAMSNDPVQDATADRVS